MVLNLQAKVEFNRSWVIALTVTKGLHIRHIVIKRF